MELAALELSGDTDSAAGIIKVDTKDCPKAMKKAGLTKPDVNIVVYRRGTKLKMGPSDFHARAVVNFVRYLTGDVSKKLADSAAINAWLRDQESTVVLGIFADFARPSHNVWIKSAEGLRPPYRFAEVSIEAASGAKLFRGASLDPTKNQFAVIPPQRWVAKEEPPFHLGTDFKAMKDFIPPRATTRIGPLNSVTRKAMVDAGRTLVGVSLDMDKMGRMFKYILNRLHKLLDAEPEIDSQFAFTIHDVKHIKGAGPDFGVDAGKDFAVTVRNFTDQSSYGTEILAAMSAENFSALPLAPFLRRIAAGEEPPFVKSEPLPDPQQHQPGRVLKVVAKNFKDVVEDAAADVLLVLHHTKEPSEAVRKVAAIFGHPDIASAKIVSFNVSANALNFDKYRFGRQEEQLYLVPASAEARPIPYDEERVDELKVANFLLKNILIKEPDEAFSQVRKAVKEMKRARDAEAEQMFPGLADEKRKKKKRKKKRKASPKQEL